MDRRDWSISKALKLLKDDDSELDLIIKYLFLREKNIAVGAHSGEE